MAKGPIQTPASDEAVSTPAGVSEFGEECGGKGGVPFEVFAPGTARLTRLTVWHRDFVDGLRLETDQGALPRIGGMGQHKDIRQDAVELGADEFLTGISVEYWNCVDRITFHTNKGSYGPFGGQGGRVKRTLSAPPGRIVVGFKGRHWELIDSIQLLVR